MKFNNKLKYFLTLFLLVNIAVTAQQWVQIGTDIDGEHAGDESGFSVSTNSDGNIVVIGAYKNDANGISSGHVRVYKNIDDNWVQLGNDIDGQNDLDKYGWAVDINSDGTIVAVGSPSSSYGHTRVFEYNGIEWIQLGDNINGESQGDNSGYNIALNSDGNIIIIGATYNDGNSDNVHDNRGHARVFEYSEGSWVQIGNDIDGEGIGDRSGSSVSIDSTGNTVAVGSTVNSGNGTNSGHVRLFENINNNWIQKGDDIDGESIEDRSGTSISLSSDGNTIAIGASQNSDNGTNSGHVRVYEYLSNNWIQKGNDIDGEATGDYSGGDVSLSANGNALVIGAHLNNGNGTRAGHARVYDYDGVNWMQKGNDIDGEFSYDFCGYSVSINNDGSIVAIGSNKNDGSGVDAGHVRIYNYSINLSIAEHQLDNIPNPVSDKLVIDSRDIKSIKIYNNIGQLIIESNNNEVNLQKLSEGMYFIKVIFENLIVTKKIIKK